ncbi:YibE/F family protein [Patulibacter sp.]|uniref:YibE/F family protein n=1 Tax=Patulibacter sp. TaxID=1912859 RepID=UPI0027248E4F|nr:YibE/F family protein [Patulibacter sp.]MDO9407534.1 YibE/F family protein [Patulibacter sp.]
MSALRTIVGTAPGRLLVGTVALVAVLTVVGLIALWPSGDRPTVPGAGTPTVAGTVTAVRSASCGGPTDQRCRTAEVRVDEGRDEGAKVQIVLGPEEVSPDLETGQRVRLADQQPAEGAAPVPGDTVGEATRGDAGTTGADPSATGADREPSYAFSGVDRRTPLVALAILFALLGAFVARGRGLLALVGTAMSLSLVVLWLVPAILDGRSPLLVATVGALAVMFVTTGLTYGVTAQSLAAVTGIGVSLLVAALLGTLWSELAGLDGKDGDLGAFALQSGGELPLQGILLAGMVIGALGVLTDTVVSQVSTVAALHRTSPQLPARALYREAFVVGRDHLAATIHTLVLAYAGATLPLLLVASANGVTFTDAINDARLAEPIVSTLVGSAALVLSVPLSTALAAVLVGRLPPAALAGHDHHHHH